LRYGREVPVDLRGVAPATEARLRSPRVVWWTVGLAVLAVLAAGMSRPTAFSGPRWWPHSAPIKGGGHPRARPVAKPKPPGSGWQLPSWVLIAAAAALAAVLLVAVARWLLRRWPGRPSRSAAGWDPVALAGRSEITVERSPEVPAVRDAIERTLQALDEEREPADAIVRRPAETPTEFTTRIVRTTVTDERPVRTLLRLYLRTRFGDHPVTAADVAVVRAALEELVRTWPSASGTGAGVR
jgi:hypothetical protein